MTLPYATASSGLKARGEILKILKGFGCQSVGFMDEFETHTVILAFTWRERDVQLRASASGWANEYLRENPWSDRRRYDQHDWEQKALEQGMIAVNSILRDWVKGQITAVETGILTFEHETVKHSISEYVNGMAHTNGIESFWALLKRGYHGTYHHMSEKHLGRYVTEFAGRHNDRNADTVDQMSRMAARMVGKRLSYRHLAE